MTKRYKWGPFSAYRLFMSTFGATFVEYTIRFEVGPFRSSTSWIKEISNANSK